MDRVCCNRWIGFAVGSAHFRPEVRVAAETSSKAEDQIQWLDDATRVCEEMYSMEIKSVSPRVPGKRPSGLDTEVHS